MLRCYSNASQEVQKNFQNKIITFTIFFKYLQVKNLFLAIIGCLYVSKEFLDG